MKFSNKNISVVLFFFFYFSLLVNVQPQNSFSNFSDVTNTSSQNKNTLLHNTSKADYILEKEFLTKIPIPLNHLIPTHHKIKNKIYFIEEKGPSNISNSYILFSNPIRIYDFEADYWETLPITLFHKLTNRNALVFSLNNHVYIPTFFVTGYSNSRDPHKKMIDVKLTNQTAQETGIVLGEGKANLTTTTYNNKPITGMYPINTCDCEKTFLAKSERSKSKTNLKEFNNKTLFCDYPSLFNSMTTIKINLIKKSKIKLDIYNH